MGLFSFFLGGAKKDNTERMQQAARGQSVVGNVLGGSPYMREWRKQNQEIGKQHREQEKSLRKQWRLQDKRMEHELGKAERKYGEDFANRKRKEIQRERDRALEDMEKREKKQNKKPHIVARTIKHYRSPSPPPPPFRGEGSLRLCAERG